MKKLDGERKNGLRALWVLLNVHTETDTVDQSFAVMQAIEKLDNGAMALWNKGFTIVSGGKTIYEWRGV